MDVSKYRKLIAAVVTIAAIQLLKTMGLEWSRLASFGIDGSQVVDQVADFLVTTAVPGFMLWAFPQDTHGLESEPQTERRNLRLYWFVGAVVTFIAIIAALAYWL